MPKNKRLSESMEDYLEAVYHIEKKKGAARSKDVAERMGVKAPSATGALQTLGEKGLINYAPYDVITLTPKGRRLARNVVLRHDTLKDFFVRILCLEEGESDDAACRLEHAISPKILERLTRFIIYIEACPIGGGKWANRFNEYCETGKLSENCEECMQNSLDKFHHKNNAE